VAARLHNELERPAMPFVAILVGFPSVWSVMQAAADPLRARPQGGRAG